MRELVKDVNYGSKVIKKSLSQVIWFWFKYVLMIGICGIVIGICALVYFTPQIPKFLSDRLPNIDLAIKDGLVSTTLTEPYIWGDKNTALVINTQGTVDDLKDYKAGVLILKNKIVAKNENETKFIDLSDFKDETKLDKNMIIKWSTENKLWLLGAGLAILVSQILILGIFYLIWQAIMFLVWSLTFWVYAKILKKKLQYLDILKLVITASVVPMLVSVLNIVFQDKLLGIVGTGILVFYTGIWIYHLPSGKK